MSIVKYDDAFKAQAVRRARESSARQASEEMRVPLSTLRVWVRNAPPEQVESPTGDTLVDRFESAVAAMSWLEASDDALVKLGRTYAEQIDRAVSDPEIDTTARTKALYLGPHLLGVLRDLGGTPATRKELTAGGQAVGGKLAALRAVETGRSKTGA